MGFNTGKMKESSFTALEPGKYKVVMSKLEWKANNANTGHYMNFEFTVLTGEDKGRKVWHLLNLDNPSAAAVEIAESEFKAIVRAVFGEDRNMKDAPFTIKQLTGKALVISTGIREWNDKEQSTATGFFPADEVPTGKPGKKDKPGKKGKGKKGKKGKKNKANDDIPF